MTDRAELKAASADELRDWVLRGDPTTRRRAVGELGRRGDGATGLWLADLLSAPDPDLIAVAIDAIARLHYIPASGQVLALLADRTQPVGVRDTAAYALGLLGASEAVPALVEALMSGEARVRSCAAGALALIGGRQAQQALNLAMALSAQSAPSAAAASTADVADLPVDYETVRRSVGQPDFVNRWDGVEAA